MKTPILRGSIMAAFLSIAVPAASTAQSNYINFMAVEPASGSNWIGNQEVPYNKVNLVWQVEATKSPVTCEVEYSFDMVHFQSAGTVSQAIATGSHQRKYSFQHLNSSFRQNNLVQYRIKLTDVKGNVSYSEVKTTALNS